MDNIVSQYLYTLWNDSHGKSSYHLSPYRGITILLTLLPMLYIISSWLSYFIAESLYILLLQLFLSFLFWEFPNIHKNGENVTTISDPMKSGSSNPLRYSCLENPMDRGPGGLWSTGSQKVGHNWSDPAHVHEVMNMFAMLVSDVMFPMIWFLLLEYF